MGARMRASRALAAEKEGSRAYREGKGQGDNPYKQGGNWSLHGYWDMGWQRERDGYYEQLKILGVG